MKIVVGYYHGVRKTKLLSLLVSSTYLLGLEAVIYSTIVGYPSY